MRPVKRRKEPTPIFEASTDWKTVPEPQAIDIMQAHVDPVRRLALELLELGAMRKFELARYIHRILGKKYSRSLVQYHLKHLEKAGMIGETPDPDSEIKASLVYKTADVRVQLKQKPAPPRAPRVPEDVVWTFMKKYKKVE